MERDGEWKEMGVCRSTFFVPKWIRVDFHQGSSNYHPFLGGKWKPPRKCMVNLKDLSKK